MPRAKTRSKRVAPVSVRSELLDSAREAGLNLSATLEAALERALAEEDRERWRQQNRAAIDDCNECVDKYGRFSDDVRGF